MSRKLHFVVFLLVISSALMAQKKPKPVPPISVGANGVLQYAPDSLGNQVPDFSYCGYSASEKKIPSVTALVYVPIAKGDATFRIQSAIDFLSRQPLDKDGFRGAIQLEKGTYAIAGQLKISHSGIVIRGAGMGQGGTQLLATGLDRRTLIRVAGKENKKLAKPIAVADAYVPVGAKQLRLENGDGLKQGDRIFIHRPSTQNWLETLGTLHFGGGLTTLGWKPGERDLYFDRTITAIDQNNIFFDAPITTALDSKYGGGFVMKYQWDGRISQVGIENLALDSEYDLSNLKDEAHSWMAITMENLEDAWVRALSFQHFAGSAVSLLESTKRITVEDCISQDPISEIGGQRRYTFITAGQQNLFQRCVANNGYHDFATGYCAAGPNAFVQCSSNLPFSFSGAIDSWASGVLFDIVNVDGNALRFGNRGQDGQGAGWAAANSLFWNCSAARIDCYQPPTAQNWAFGSWSQFAGDGYWDASNNSISPRSLYYAQLAQRLNSNVDDQARLMKVTTEASSSPSVAVAMSLTAEAGKPQMQLDEWILIAASKNNFNISTKGIKSIDQIGFSPMITRVKAPALTITNGVINRNQQLQIGRRQGVPWWNGGIQGKDLVNAQPAITRWVPGRIGKGLTDDLDALTDTMLKNRIIGMEQNYALWYERRRDDHERIRRMDGEVWAPFYELPFARSGKELAWDGLSKYDLTKYNPWYWGRLKTYANLADEKGLLLVHQNYFQHNIIEAGAHYADFPWRTANNINQTGFPEPVPYAGDKRIFMAEQFYDISNPVRRALHVKYIRQCLENFKDNHSVIQLTGEEFTGPYHFVKFWIETVAAWEKEKGVKQLIGLSVTKDVQDSILANPALAQYIDLIDIRYWHLQADGSAYAPKGGQNLAPRQHARLLKPKKSSFEQVYLAVKNYRQLYPSKAVMYSSDSFDQFGWAVLMAGGSLPVLPELPANFLKAVTNMKPVEGKQYLLSNQNKEWIIYCNKGEHTIPQVDPKQIYQLVWIDPKNGSIFKEIEVLGAALEKFEKPVSNDLVAWIKK